MKKMVFYCERCPANAPADSGYTYIVPNGWCEVQAEIILRYGLHNDKEVCELYYCPKCFQEIKAQIKLGLKQDFDQLVANRLKSEVRKEFDNEQKQIEERKILNQIKKFIQDPVIMTIGGMFLLLSLAGFLMIYIGSH